MNSKTRIYPTLTVVAAAVVFLVPVACSAQEEEPADEAVAEVPSPFGEDSSISEAVDDAFTIPTNWDYDPASRYIYPEGADIPFPLSLDDSVWRDRLEPFEYYILREKGTEYSFSNLMYANEEHGIYYSRATGQPLFSSEDKYDSRTGWPSFTKPINPYAIVYIGDATLWPPRIEVVDSLSGSHLGHVFPDGPPPTRQRYCINAASLIFVPDGEDPPDFIRALVAMSADTK